MTALREHAARHGQQIPVLVDTTLAPLYPLFAQEFTHWKERNKAVPRRAGT